MTLEIYLLNNPTQTNELEGLTASEFIHKALGNQQAHLIRTIVDGTIWRFCGDGHREQWAICPEPKQRPFVSNHILGRKPAEDFSHWDDCERNWQ